MNVGVNSLRTAELVSEINELVEKKRDRFIQLSDKIWASPETRFQEHQSSEILCQALEEEGFQVEREVGGIKTAFIGTYGSGKPVIALLGEFDALSGLSQKSGVAEKMPLVEGGNGHGCGHNLLGTSPLAAVVAIKEYMKEHNLQGTIKYYGCPGEEGGSGKTFMVRERLFDDVDCALTWHPNSFNGVFTVSSLANYQVYFKFKGTASHAANSPHLGRSALDAVELMNVGVNYLREHIIPEARVHYSIVNTGGMSPNVVQAEAEVLYLIRAPKLAEVKSIYERVVKIAEGAALMTETTVEVKFDKACSDYNPNTVLGKLVHNQLAAFGGPAYTDEEIQFGKSMKEKITKEDVDNALLEIKKTSEALTAEKKKELQGYPFCVDVLPFKETDAIMFGSTDVGDVSWVVPTAQFFSTCFVFGTPLHTWQLVSQGATSIAHKGMLQAGKVLAASAIELFKDPSIIEQAKVELESKLEESPYFCPIPDGVEPSPLR
jgi:aminobenzoyl-glutamate utilization protein B